MNVAAHYQITGASSEEIAAELETAVHDGRLAPGERLPPIRSLAETLAVSPGTVASAYRRLRERGLAAGEGRRGTTVRPHPALARRLSVDVPPGVRDLADGSPDPALLPPLDRAVAALDLRSRRYDDGGPLPALVELGAALFAADGLPAGPFAVVGGARDGIERALAAWTRPGDRVGLEDPCFTGILDLVAAMGLEPVPVRIDTHGPLPDSLAGALGSGLSVVVVTPRAQNPTGAALDAARAAELRRVLDGYPRVLVIEDDHAGPVAVTPAHTLVTPDRGRWVIVRSVSKALGPDLRLALLTGDPTTVTRVEGRQLLGTGWVSTLLQQLVLALLRDDETADRLAHAATVYAERQRGAVAALRNVGLDIAAPSGSNLWIPVPEETAVVRGLLDAGWAVGSGERHRIATPPAIRAATTTLDPSDADGFAADLARVLTRRSRRPAS
jgi:DNA-binding transcriptional MocR family regulator